MFCTPQQVHPNHTQQESPRMQGVHTYHRCSVWALLFLISCWIFPGLCIPLLCQAILSLYNAHIPCFLCRVAVPSFVGEGSWTSETWDMMGFSMTNRSKTGRIQDFVDLGKWHVLRHWNLIYRRFGWWQNATELEGRFGKTNMKQLPPLECYEWFGGWS